MCIRDSTATADATVDIKRAAGSYNAAVVLYINTTAQWLIGQHANASFSLYSYGTSTDVFVVDRTTGNITTTGTINSGYVASAFGATADPGANPQYTVGVADTHETRMYIRALTINGTTVHVVCTD